MSSIEDVQLSYAKKAYNNYLLKKSKSDNGKDCHISLKRPRSDGYVRWSITKGSTSKAFQQSQGERTFYLHHLAWYATEHQMPTPIKEHLSHRCNDSRCFNPNHLVVETPKENNSRKNCAVNVFCPCCSKIVNVKHKNQNVCK